jgi:hypothetical protein
MSRSLPQPPNDTDKDFRQKWMEYEAVLKQYISNNMYQDGVFKQLTSDYDSGNRVHSSMLLIIAMLNAIQKELGKIDLRVAYFAAQETLVNILKDLAQTGRKPLTDEEITQLTQQTLKTYLSTHKGEYDAVKAQLYLKQLADAKASGQLEQIAAQNDAKRTGASGLNQDSLLPQSAPQPQQAGLLG